MQLTCSDDKVYRAPTAEVIAEVLAGLGAKLDFVILERDNARFMQSSGDAQGRCDLEYCDGGQANHFRCPLDLTIQQVIQAFQEYAAGSDEYRQRLPWEPLFPKAKPPRPVSDDKVYAGPADAPARTRTGWVMGLCLLLLLAGIVAVFIALAMRGDG